MCMTSIESGGARTQDTEDPGDTDESEYEEDDDIADTLIGKGSIMAATSTAATSALTWDDPDFERFCYEDDKEEEHTDDTKWEPYEQPMDPRMPDELPSLPIIQPLRPRKVKPLRRVRKFLNLRSQAVS
ncbi:hypothetical protein TWF730_008970 [Orbilia blumenaviensis]|uniref:Uncharacterized protein n=1 Tax=Orbilia blumenaviensis TaxID=1796055 RepID=A0AAV9V0Z8_9PEZI